MARQQDIAQALQRGGVSVFGLRVEEHGDIVSLYGSVADDKDRQQAERLVADTMHVKVANHLTTQSTLADKPAAASAGNRRYTVKAGDTLSKIAKEHYGDASQWKRIHQANAASIPNPDLIHPGLELVIPE